MKKFEYVGRVFPGVSSRHTFFYFYTSLYLPGKRSRGMDVCLTGISEPCAESLSLRSEIFLDTTDSLALFNSVEEHAADFPWSEG